MFPPSLARQVALRWTIGHVADRGFDALRLSLWGAWHVFGPAATYVVCVNTVGIDQARQRTGPVPAGVQWRATRRDDMPAFLKRAFGPELAGSMGWKLAPLQLFPDRYELSLDNDCILWECPAALRAWLEQVQGTAGLMAEDVVACHASFARLCPPQGVNAGLRGVPPGFDLEGAIESALNEWQSLHDGTRFLEADDEQGLQVAALSRATPVQVVPFADLSVCSPFHPHLPGLGRCGAHFVGINARHIPWDHDDRPADEWSAEHWQQHLPELVRRTGAPGFTFPPADSAASAAFPRSGSSPLPSRRRPAALLSPSARPAAETARIP